MFCGGKDKKKKKSNMEQPQLKAVAMCKIHKMEYTSVALDLGSSDERRMCANCKQSYKGAFVDYSNIYTALQQQDIADFAYNLKEKIPPGWDQEWRENIVDRIKNLKNIIIKFEEQILQNFLLTTDAPKSFTHHDLNLLVDTKIVDDFFKITNQQLRLNQAESDDLVYIVAKVVSYFKDANLLFKSMQSDFKVLQSQMSRVQEELKIKIDTFEKSLQNVNTIYKQAQMVSKDPVYDFLEEAKSITQQQNTQLQQAIQKFTPKSKLQSAQQSEVVEHQQIKSIQVLSEQLLVYATNSLKIHIVKLPEFTELEVLEEEGDLCSLSRGMINGELHLVVAFEEAGQGILSIWNLNTLQKVTAFNAHEGYIWNIIELPQGKLASCSEDKSVKVFDLSTRKATQHIQFNQASVNDIALVTQNMIAFVSDDQIVSLTNYETGEQVGMAYEDYEIKSVCPLDGTTFCTGNTAGEVRIYHIKGVELLVKLKPHESVTRFIVRVSPKIFVTSSWDGTHAFINSENQQVIKTLEGPKKNFSESLAWVPGIGGTGVLAAGSKGRVTIYK